jgi:hypothetical protein
VVSLIGFTPKGSVRAVGFDSHVLRTRIKLITDLRIGSRFPVPKLTSLCLRPLLPSDMRSFQSLVHATAILRFAHLSRDLAYLLLVFCLAFFISAAIATLTAVCGESTGGNSKTVTYLLA